jgi:hypothetical protein
MDEVIADAPPADVSDEVKTRANELKDTGNKQLAGESWLSSAALALHRHCLNRASGYLELSLIAVVLAHALLAINPYRWSSHASC